MNKEIIIQYKNSEGETTKLVGLIIHILTTCFGSLAMSSRLENPRPFDLVESSVITNVNRKNLKILCNLLKSLKRYGLIDYEELFFIDYPQK